jgi:hypothetical protein
VQALVKAPTVERRCLLAGRSPGATSRLYAVTEPAPPAFWPRRIAVASDPAGRSLLLAGANRRRRAVVGR